MILPSGLEDVHHRLSIGRVLDLTTKQFKSDFPYPQGHLEKNLTLSNDSTMNAVRRSALITIGTRETYFVHYELPRELRI